MLETRPQPTTDAPIGTLDNPSWIRRAMLIEQVASRYVRKALAGAQQRAAEDAFRVALYDSEPLVRCVLADSLKRVAEAPRDILRQLARDEAQVAQPVLRCSPTLGEEDLIRIVREYGRSHRLAIAERDRLSPRVAEALYATNDPAVVRRLLANDGAALAEAMLHAILDRFGQVQGIVETMADRQRLPESVIDRLRHYGLGDLNRRSRHERIAV